MIPSIKAIPTYYNGNFFRARIEARHALFFDLIGLNYIYEIDGYPIPNQKAYLPDFWLPDLHCFAEVKPDYFGVYKMQCCDVNLIRKYEEFEKWEHVSHSHMILLLIDNPNPFALPVIDNGEIYTKIIYRPKKNEFWTKSVDACFRGIVWGNEIKQANKFQFDHYDAK